MFKNLFGNPVDTAKTKINEFVQLKVEQAKISAVEKAGPIVGLVVICLLVAFFTLLLLMFLGIGLALWLSVLFDNNFIAGFLVTGGVFLLLLILVMAFSKPIMKGITNIVAKLIL